MSSISNRALEALAQAEELVDERGVQFAIDQTALRIAVELRESDPIVMCVMHGGLPYTAELMKRFGFPLELSYVHVGRYANGTRGGILNWYARPKIDLADRNVLIVDDVLDKGETLSALVAWVADEGAKRVRTTVLVLKEVARGSRIEVDYVALRLPDRYLFGCGMDYRGYWRNLGSIYALHESME
ncbi:MAG: hypoxanthine-guanine phosphoribosyltransferase [Gammaproteobacteria bacterium]|nr:hypoxanthine-guanine phosphoribosyltransferase [Gammaproteobacteria bacterium]